MSLRENKDEKEKEKINFIRNKCIHYDKLILQFSNNYNINKNINKDLNININSFYCNNCKEIFSFGFKDNYIKAIPFEDINTFYYKNNHNNIDSNDEINILLIYENMRKFNYNNYNYKEDSLEYEIDRKDAIDFISELGIKYKISEDCMYSAILYMDIIANEDKNIIENLDIYAIGCFFLAGKIKLKLIFIYLLSINNYLINNNIIIYSKIY
jgi:hypothetical protein